jgi:antirestriction protein ArdC
MAAVSTRSRQPKGVPVGGQFAAESKTEPTLTLGTVAPAAETVFTKRYDTLDEKVAAFHDELEKHVADLADDENWTRYLVTMSKFHRYSLFNQLLITLQRPDASKVAGYRKWQELGRQVNKGEKGISIFAPKAVRMDLLDAAGNPVIDPATGKPKKQNRVIGFTTATVFDVAQTDGEPLPEVERTISEEPPEGLIEDLESAITERGFTVAYEEIPGSAEGYTSPRSKRVVVDASLPAGSRAAVLAHELGHIAAGHLERTDEYHTGHGGQRGVMELEAESIAYSLCRANGLSTAQGGVSATYIAGWTRNEPDAIKESAERVSKTVKGILSAGTWRNLPEA